MIEDMDKTYKDTDLREALRRKYAETPGLPADFMTKMRQQTETEPARKVMLWRWVAAAACLIIIIGIGLTMAPFGSQTKDESLMAKQAETEPAGSPTTVQTKETVSSPRLNNQFIQPELSVQTVRTIANSPTKSGQGLTKAPAQPVSESVTKDEPSTEPLRPTENLHYASYNPAADTLYQAPCRMDEFIVKMAGYNKVKAVALDCASGSADSTIVSTAYVFADKEDFDLFARLLQAACWYDSKTPGYLLNFSHQQFFFTLKDLRKGEKYLWIAERLMDGRILLFSTHSPIETEVSAACYQTYREQLTHTNPSTLHF